MLHKRGCLRIKLVKSQEVSLLNRTHPLGGSAIIALGLTRSESTMMRRWEPSKEATSMRSFVESVQNTVRPRWSMAMPSGLSKSVDRFQFKHQMRRADVKGEQSRSKGSTWFNDRNGLSPLDAGLAYGGWSDLGPVYHFVHAVIGHSDDYLLLERGRRQTIFEVQFIQVSTFTDRNTEQMFAAFHVNV